MDIHREHTTIKELPVSERPYEKCMEHGPQILSDAELLAVILRSGTKDARATALAFQILNIHPYYQGLLGICHTTIKDLKRIKGIGTVKAVQIVCIAELSRRISAQKVHNKISFQSPESIADYYMEQMRHLDREEMILILFNGKNRVIKELKISEGTVNQTLASPRELLIEAIRYEAVFMILLHNHPSGDPAPSRNDLEATKRISKAGELVGILLSDHIIIGDHSFVSFRKSGLL